jgi:UDP-GlcNAc3NAcA epimerase
MKILTVVGNRPQFVKASAVSGLLRREHEEVLVHTGQHYDESLSRVFFAELGLAEPERELGLGGGSNTSQTARMLAALEGVIEEIGPKLVLVYGDTNSTLAGGLAGAQAGVAVAHVEAGMRSFDRRMPEELNRVLTDHLSGLLLCASESSRENLERESVAGQVEVVGDVMVDVALSRLPAAEADDETLARHGVGRGEYLLCTAHRAGNVDDPDRLAMLVGLLRGLGGEDGERIVFPVHPRTRARLRAGALLEELQDTPGLELCEPLPYTELAALLCGARAVLTDSGGVQKEAYLARVPCITLRDRTEWTETVRTGWNTLVDLDLATTRGALGRERPEEHPELYGDGHAAERCVAAIGAFGQALERAGGAEGVGGAGRAGG